MLTLQCINVLVIGKLFTAW